MGCPKYRFCCEVHFCECLLMVWFIVGPKAKNTVFRVPTEQLHTFSGCIDWRLMKSIPTTRHHIIYKTRGLVRNTLHMNGRSHTLWIGSISEYLSVVYGIIFQKTHSVTESSPIFLSSDRAAPTHRSELEELRFQNNSK